MFTKFNSIINFVAMNVFFTLSLKCCHSSFGTSTSKYWCKNHMLINWFCMYFWHSSTFWQDLFDGVFIVPGYWVHTWQCCSTLQDRYHGNRTHMPHNELSTCKCAKSRKPYACRKSAFHDSYSLTRSAGIHEIISYMLQNLFAYKIFPGLQYVLPYCDGNIYYRNAKSR